jgi:K(+)-stimulated pyrophosphate-energized sodium pump
MYFAIGLLTPETYYTATAFLIGSVVSIISGSIGMSIATSANYRTTYAAKKGLPIAFKTAYRAGVAMGFALVSLGLLVLILLIVIYKSILGL